MLVVAVFVIWIGGISVRLVNLQVTQHAWLKERAVDLRQDVKQTRMLRGTIFDRDERALAMSVRVKTLYADPSEMADTDAAAKRIANVLKIDAAQLAQRKDAPRLVIVRDDSSASWGTETARWRVKGDRLRLAIGGEWEDYKLKLKGQTLTLSEGDLTKPVSFQKVGPPTSRPAGVAVPPDPDLGGQ